MKNIIKINNGVKYTLSLENAKNGERYVWLGNDGNKFEIHTSNTDVCGNMDGLRLKIVSESNTIDTFSLNRQYRHSAYNVLINAGVSVREAVTALRATMDYLFISKKECDLYDLQNDYLIN